MQRSHKFAFIKKHNQCQERKCLLRVASMIYNIDVETNDETLDIIILS